CAYVWLEKYFSRGDYRRKDPAPKFVPPTGTIPISSWTEAAYRGTAHPLGARGTPLTLPAQ
ncbi:MAG TPA: hypothetical protein VM029_06115, partial [Opitutaceae bacterium]|nr:hypothetical protein [Opitutaceae bacterium]